MDDRVSKRTLDAVHKGEAHTRKALDSAASASRPQKAPDAVAHSGELPDHVANFISGAQPWVPLQFGDFAKTARRMMNLVFQSPQETLENYQRFWSEQLRVLTGTSEVAPARDDHRFDDPTWHENSYYKFLMQAHLAWRDEINAWIDGLPIEHREAERLRFMTTVLTEAAAPSNWSNNPAALKRYLETGGMSAWRGLQHMIDDAVLNGGMPATVKRGALQVGRDMATTPGKVVYRSEVLELLQYAPTTAKVRARPFLMIPPQINRFYFYDLSEKKSLIRWAVDSGLQTFAISWRNPGPAHSSWNFDTYLAAIEEAIDVVCDITDSEDVNIEGGCVAGINVVALLADLAAREERKVNSATLLVTMLDTSVETQLGVLATPQGIDLARVNSRMRGVMAGSEMGKVFAYLRPNDLIWNYWVNNYLLGNDPPTFDVLAWNADTTRMAAGFHVQVLDLVENNSLVRGKFEVRGEPVDISQVDCDQFWLAGFADHITPWRACYASSRLLKGKREFVVSDGGHIQSMISSPSNPKAKYFVNDAQPDDADEWLDGASEHTGSWWLRWRDWITARSGELVAAPRTFGNRAHPALGYAPGTYVLEP